MCRKQSWLFLLFEYHRVYIKVGFTRRDKDHDGLAQFLEYNEDSNQLY